MWGFESGLRVRLGMGIESQVKVESWVRESDRS